jgi:hypothetical protein
VGFRTLVVVSDQYDGGRPQTIETTTDVVVAEGRVTGYDHTDRKHAIFISSTEAGYSVDGKVAFSDPVDEVIQRGDIPMDSTGSTNPTTAAYSGGSTLQPSSVAPNLTEAVTFDTVCDAVPLDTQAVVTAGRAYTAGQLTSAQLQQLLAHFVIPLDAGRENEKPRRRCSSAAGNAGRSNGEPIRGHLVRGDQQ